jgi:hypothetical protein
MVAQRVALERAGARDMDGAVFGFRRKWRSLSVFSLGLYQVNALVPAESAKGNAVPVAIAIGGATSNTVSIAVQQRSQK